MSTRPARRTKTTAPRGKRTGSASGEQRLQKVLAAAGVASRRQCEELILDGRVEVDRCVVTELGVRVDPQKQSIRVDGEKIISQRQQYFIVNKPRGVVSTNSDPQRRPRVVDFVDSTQRLFTIGRLDKSSEGLILVTNDGPLANRLAHPRYEVEKTYLVEVAGKPQGEHFRQLTEGMRLAEGRASVSRLRVKRRFKQSTQLELVLKEGRNREIRRLLARIGHKVLRLKRIAMGPIKLGDLPIGASRRLTSRELQLLRRSDAKRAKRPTATKSTSKKSPAKRSSTVNERPDSRKKRAQQKRGTGRIIGADRKKGSAGKKKAPVKGSRAKGPRVKG